MIKNRKNIIIFYINLISFIIFPSCITQKQFVNKNTMCGIIIDEHNRPVSNYRVICSNNFLNKQAVYTNQSGIFVFENMDVGEYKISGSKNNFCKIENEQYYFDGTTSFFCGQVSSLNQVVNNINQFLKNKEYGKAIDLINLVEVNEKEYNYGLVLLYKAYLYGKLNDLKSYLRSMNELKKLKNDKCRAFIKEGDIGV